MGAGRVPGTLILAMGAFRGKAFVLLGGGVVTDHPRLRSENMYIYLVPVYIIYDKPLAV